MKQKSYPVAAVFAAMLFSILPYSRGGDAIAVTYDGNGSVTSASTECSSTKVGGKDYMTAQEAAEKALTGAKAKLAFREALIHSSDLTGFFAFATGSNAQGTVIAKVGYGKTQEDADKNALKKLSDDGAKNNLGVRIQYFSYGKSE